MGGQSGPAGGTSVTGLVGGTVTGRALSATLGELHEEPWYERERMEAAPYGLGLLTHGTRDPDGTTTVNAGDRFGAVYGAVTNRTGLGWSWTELFDRLLSAPAETARALEGPFVLAAADAAGRAVVATDKLGTRRCHYTEAPFTFGTDVGALLGRLAEPTVDGRGLTDLVTVGQVWGGRTLVEEVRSVPPGTVLVHDADSGTLQARQYWDPPFDAGEPPTGEELYAEYSRVIEAAGGSVGPGTRAGLWLSGGLDSRTMAAELSRHRELGTYTYDANPPTGANLDLAARVADLLGLDNERVPLTAEGFARVLETGVKAVDGMVPWSTFLNLSAAFRLPGQPGVVLEGSGQGGLLGNDVWASDLDRGRSAADALYRSHHYVDRETARDLLATGHDPMRTYREEAAGPGGYESRVLRAYRRNFYPYGEFASNAVARTQAGTRVPFADGDFLRLVGRIPRSARTGAVPLTRGRVPYGTAKYKLELARQVDDGVDRVPYERTGVQPVRPLWAHAAGFIVSTTLDRLRGATTYGGGTLAGEWYRGHDGLRARVDGLLDDVCDRPWVEEGPVRRLQRAHLEGEADNSNPVAALTTAEQWLQSNAL